MGILSTLRQRKLLIDAGHQGKRLRTIEIDRKPEDLDAIFDMHEHS